MSPGGLTTGQRGGPATRSDNTPLEAWVCDDTTKVKMPVRCAAESEMFDVRLLVLEDLLVLTTPLMICLGCLGCLLLRPAGAMYASSHRDFLLPAAAV
jgi:hypothetical protein